MGVFNKFLYWYFNCLCTDGSVSAANLLYLIAYSVFFIKHELNKPQLY